MMELADKKSVSIFALLKPGGNVPRYWVAKEKEQKADGNDGQGGEAPVMQQFLKTRTVLLTGEVNKELAERVVRQLLLLEQDGEDPIKVFIDSPGGDADAGFATDPDGDRLAIVDENGSPLGEEFTLAIAIDGFLNSTKVTKPVVVNLSTSMLSEYACKRHGVELIRSKVGEINVVEQMKIQSSEIGGEGNGGIILREAHLGRDSLVAATMVLNRMSQSNGSLSKIHQSLPQFEIVKDKVNLEGIDPDQLIKKVSSVFENFEINTLDGVKFTWIDRWVHLRKSNTEPIMRIYAEAPNKAEAENLVQQIRTCL